MFFSSSVIAAELNAHAGGLHSTSGSEPTFSWDLEYRQAFAENLSASFIWLNEGHLPRHHRDGQSVQLWWHTRPTGRQATLLLGVGPYRYFDTVEVANANGYINVHGWGALTSLELNWPIAASWTGSLRFNYVYVENSFKTYSLLAGVGYRFGQIGQESATTRVAQPQPGAGRWELDVMAGATVENSTEPNSRMAKAIGLRARATRHVTGSLAYLDEGNLSGGRRAGVTPQVWLESEPTSGLSVSAGIGPYFVTNKPQLSDGGGASSVSTMISVSAAYAFTPRWNGRLLWNRVETRYHRDSDVILFALGYRF